MDNRKESEAVSTSDDRNKMPEQGAPGDHQLQDSDNMCQYLQRANLGKWEDKFREQKITGVTLRYIEKADLEKMGIECLGDRLHILLSLRDLYHIEVGLNKINMESQKRPSEAVSTSDDQNETPERRVSGDHQLQDSDYMQWDVEEMCQYLQRENLGKWEDKFREQKITGVTLRYMEKADLEKMGIECLGDRLQILHSLGKLWQIEINMDNQKESEAVSTSDDQNKTPEQGAPGDHQLQDLDYMQWGVEETCQYLQRENLGEWEAKFREQKITGVTLRRLKDADLEKMGIECLGDRLQILHSLRTLWQKVRLNKINMDNQKRPSEAVSTSDDQNETPEQGAPGDHQLQDSHYIQWDVEETCQYLQRENLGKWEDKFREQKITGVTLRYIEKADLEKMGIECLDDHLQILHSLGKLWQKVRLNKDDMDNLKRPFEEDSTSDDKNKTPEQGAPGDHQLQDSDYMQWGVEKTCQYLRREDLGKWEDKFRAQKIRGVTLRRLKDADLEKMGIECLGDRLHILHSLRKLWQKVGLNKINMDNQKRPSEVVSTSDDKYKTPERRVSGDHQLQDSDYMQWDVEETCQYLQRENLGKWKDKFREQKITGVTLRYIKKADLEKMGIECLGDRLQVLHSLGKLWQIEGGLNKVFNDPIHGHVELHPLLIKIVDTPQFQRLRYIKQLGGIYFVYPGASHNRFEHSIGVGLTDDYLDERRVGYLAGRLAQALKTRQPELDISDRDILCVQIAGLCHDLGHGPFSHMFDEMFIFKVRPEKKWKHEKASLAMFDHMVKVNELKSVMEDHGLVLPEDLIFIKELIAGPLDANAAQDQEWQYKGRPKDKSFLYEIVANKRNGIDVDKWDYFARDCHHLGIQNNFDYRRFIKFARVCEVAGEKQICTRDKEVGNVCDMFHTRYGLHRRACQHTVAKIIETMITEAFIEADKYIQIEGSGGKKFTLSTAIDDMEAYTKLTDGVFEQILNSSSKELAEARHILHKVVNRRLYKCVGESPAEKPERVTQEMICSWEPANGSAQDVSLKPDDFDVHFIDMHYGMKENNPIDNVHFYSKDDPTKATKIPEEKVATLLPRKFAEKLYRLYYKKTDAESLEAAKEFGEWWEKENFQPQDGYRKAPKSDNNEGEDGEGGSSTQ